MLSMSEELEQYHQKGGTYVIPVEIMNYWIGEYEDLQNKVEKLTQENNDLEETLILKQSQLETQLLKNSELRVQLDKMILKQVKGV